MSSDEPEPTSSEKGLLSEPQYDGIVRVKWDWLCLGYTFFTTGTAFAFAMSNDSKFTKAIFFIGSLHFITETSISMHLIWEPRIAKIISIIAAVLYGILAIVVALPESVMSLDTSMKLFLGIFISSDMNSLVCSLACHMATEAAYSVKKIAWAISLHWIGIGWALATNIAKTDVSGHKARMLGGGWAALGVINAFQVYLMKDALQGRMNHLMAPRDTKVAKYLGPILALLSSAGLLAINFGKVGGKGPDSNDPEKFLFAQAPGIKDFIMFAGFPLSGAVLGVAVFFYLGSHGENVKHPDPVEEHNYGDSGAYKSV